MSNEITAYSRMLLSATNDNGSKCYWDSDCSSLCCSQVCKDMSECNLSRNYPRTLF